MLHAVFALCATVISTETRLADACCWCGHLKERRGQSAPTGTMPKRFLRLEPMFDFELVDRWADTVRCSNCNESACTTTAPNTVTDSTRTSNTQMSDAAIEAYTFIYKT